MADDLIYWEDLQPGEALDLGSHRFTAKEIIAFARRYDPQFFHVDPASAKKSFYKGLIASGWHTCAIAMRLMVDSYIGRAASLGSPGLDNIRWLAPVRAGDTITYRRRIIAARRSASRPGAGLVQTRWEAQNQRGEMVMTMEGWGMFGMRPAKSPGYRKRSKP